MPSSARRVNAPPTRWAIYDLDGTVCNVDHRNAYRERREWDRFHERCVDDEPYMAEILIARSWVERGGNVAIITGRTEPYKFMTMAWLSKFDFPYGPLYMRGEHNVDPDTTFKHQALLTLQRDEFRDGDEISFFMEDDDRLVALWRSLGYTCLQPRHGVFNVID